MATPSQELEAEVEQLRKNVNELVEAYGLDDDDDESETVEIPVGGRTNHKEGVTESLETNQTGSRTETQEVRVPTGGRSNYEQGNGGTIEREISVNDDPSILEWRATLNEMQAEMEQERVNRRQGSYERLHGEGEREVDPEKIPAGGRTNWERRQED
ncbi:hypothetical protein [Salinadaptatus halalkaliphilus]|uniref:hypothetical protein n=1 Tax=Salinadaptatus halalkaliphilus TaxID=2419781 RepID=UPI0011441640|nr:hypothetical protein [Salinadaptatus halalkaliphilus]